MKTKYLFGLAGVLSALALPAAAADWNHIADVSVTPYPAEQSHHVHLANAVNALSFRSDGPLSCSSIEATSNDGVRDQVFSGTLEGGQRVVDLGAPGRDLTSIEFNCHSLSGAPTEIDVAADTGPLPDAGYQNTAALPDIVHERTAEALPPIIHERQIAAPPVIAEDEPVPINREWVGVGHQWYSPVSQPKSFFIGGDNVTSITLKPTRADAVCFQGLAILYNGEARPIDVDDFPMLNRDRFYTFRLPDAPDVREVQLDCRAKNGAIVAMNVYADRSTEPVG